MESIRQRYARVFRSLGRAELQREAHELESLEDLLTEEDPRWLGFYTAEGLRYALESYGFFSDLRTRGFESFDLKLRTEDAHEHMLRVGSAVPKLQDPMLELVTRRARLSLREEVEARFPANAVSVLGLEWLQLQNPLVDFDPERPPLPGQRHPGLGLGSEVFEMLRNVCLRLKLSGLVNVPAFFHNAVLYSGAFFYIDPAFQGRFEALQRDLFLRDDLLRRVGPDALLAATSWALEWKMVREAQGHAPVVWFHEPMIASVCDEVEAYRESDWYVEEVARVSREVSYEALLEPLVQRLEAKGIVPWDAARARAFLDSQLA